MMIISNTRHIQVYVMYADTYIIQLVILQPDYEHLGTG
jgi:hypothetical protein